MSLQAKCSADQATDIHCLVQTLQKVMNQQGLFHMMQIPECFHTTPEFRKVQKAGVQKQLFFRFTEKQRPGYMGVTHFKSAPTTDGEKIRLSAVDRFRPECLNILEQISAEGFGFCDMVCPEGKILRGMIQVMVQLKRKRPIPSVEAFQSILFRAMGQGILKKTGGIYAKWIGCGKP